MEDSEAQSEAKHSVSESCEKILRKFNIFQLL